MQFDVSITTPKGLYKQTKASIINVVSADGQRGILPNHSPIVMALAISKMTMEEERRETYAIAGGTLFFRNNRCTILTQAIEHVDEIDLDKAIAAKERAEHRLGMAESSQDEQVIDVARASKALQRANNRIAIKTGER